uniref:Pentacotripeptide-repeat region of PRORP domain-containing protein n=1 Tax=Populus trichocarpa TaxID=3694 RepID=A0A2K2BJV0_POPTR
MEFFNEILTSGCSPDAIVYYNMISGFSQDGRMDGGSFVLSKWKEVGFRPDTVCYDVLIGGFCWKNKFNRVFALLKEMDEAGLKPAIAYNTLIALYQQNWGFKVCPESPEKDDQGRLDLPEKPRRCQKRFMSEFLRLPYNIVGASLLS